MALTLPKLGPYFQPHHCLTPSLLRTLLSTRSGMTVVTQGCLCSDLLVHPSQHPWYVVPPFYVSEDI